MNDKFINTIDKIDLFSVNKEIRLQRIEELFDRRRWCGKWIYCTYIELA